MWNSLYHTQNKTSWLQLLLALAAIKLIEPFRPRNSAVLFLTKGICVKYGLHQQLSEAAVLQFIGKYTSIPVPKVYCAFQWNEITYIVMSRLHGCPVSQSWSKRSDQSKAKILAQLKELIEEMRALKPPTVGVSGINGSKLYDMRISGGVHGFGPFASVRDFHLFLSHSTKYSADNPTEVNTLLEMYRNSRYSPRFTHGDLSSQNILVSEDGEDVIVGIVDWTTSGWYPEYWEYTTVLDTNTYNEFWKDEISKVLGEYPEAIEMEKLRRKFFSSL
jgi:aminoglycoside phosphotransferase